MTYLVGEALDYILNVWLKNLLAEVTIGNAKTGITIYNDIVGKTISMLTTNPMRWNEQGWKLISQEIYPAFLVVACPLVAIFWLAAFCAESIDPKMHGDVRPETLLISFFKLAVAEFVTTYSLYFVCFLFGFVDALTDGWVGNNARIPTKLGFTIAEINQLPLLSVVLVFLFSLVYFGVLVFVAGVILYTATVRFFKILALIPFGTLASSTIAGTREVSRSALSFWKYILSVILEAVAIMLMLALFSRIQSSIMLVNLSGDLEIIGMLLNRIMFAFLCLGSVKGAETLLQKGLGI